MDDETIRQQLRLIIRAMKDPDNWVISMLYLDRKGKATERKVSPIRFTDDGESFMALCLCREEPRRFVIDRCSEVKLIRAEDVLMPEPIVEKNGNL